jgi:uncharacterized protein
VTAEPRVEELLATIRKAIDNDISELDRASPAKSGARANAGVGGSMREMRVSYGEAESPSNADQELARLRQRVGRPKLEEQFPQNGIAPRLRAPSPVAARGGQVGAILAGQGTAYAPQTQPPPLRQTYAPEYEQAPPMSYAPQAYAEPAWVEEAPQPEPYYQPHPPGGALLSPEAAYATQASFQALANSMLSQLSGEGRLEDVSRDMLRPLLKQWLDDHLPSLVEKLVREEIERVARRGR